MEHSPTHTHTHTHSPTHTLQNVHNKKTWNPFTLGLENRKRTEVPWERRQPGGAVNILDWKLGSGQRWLSVGCLQRPAVHSHHTHLPCHPAFATRPGLNTAFNTAFNTALTRPQHTTSTRPPSLPSSFSSLLLLLLPKGSRDLWSPGRHPTTMCPVRRGPGLPWRPRPGV